MGGKRLLNNKRSFFDRWILSPIKSKGSEILVGVIIGIILLLLTPAVNKHIETNEKTQTLKENLSAISLGISSNYVDETFGAPMVSQVLQPTTFSLEEEGTSGVFASSAYKLDNCVLLCLYYDNSLVAFTVVVNSEGIYKIPANIHMDTCYLLDFTYADFSSELDATSGLDLVAGNVPANNDHLAYYYEVYYGANPANYNSFIIGSYKDYDRGSASFALMVLGQQYYLSKHESEYPALGLTETEMNEYLTLRTLVKPNVFGLVDERFANEFNFVFDVVGSRSNASLLFGDWSEEV